MCIVCGFTLSICLEYKPGVTTFKYIAINSLLMIGLSYGCYIAYRDYKIKIGISLELYLFLVGLFGKFTITLVNKFGKFGIRQYTQLILKRLLAISELDEGKLISNKDDKPTTDKSEPPTI
jgi:hypothetical protein